ESRRTRGTCSSWSRRTSSGTDPVRRDCEAPAPGRSLVHRTERTMARLKVGYGAGAARLRIRRRALPALVMLLSATALLSACEGDNLFTGEGPSFVPRVTALAAPEVALGGDTIRVRVDAVAQRGISRVDISL